MVPLACSRGQMVREATLTEADLAEVARCRRDHNRLGFAYQAGFVRLFNRFPAQQPLEICGELLNFIALQLGIDEGLIADYAPWQHTASEHQERIREYLRLTVYGPRETAALERFIFDESWIAGGVLILLVTALATVAWRQEVGDRRPPLPTMLAAAEATDRPSPIMRLDPHGIEQVWVSPGWFRRGSDPRRDFWHARADETPQHDVHITRGFWLDRYEVTNAAFGPFVSDGGYRRREYWCDEGWTWKADR
jgi:hypothetical protein